VTVGVIINQTPLAILNNQTQNIVKERCYVDEVAARADAEQKAAAMTKTTQEFKVWTNPLGQEITVVEIHEVKVDVISVAATGSSC